MKHSSPKIAFWSFLFVLGATALGGCASSKLNSEMKSEGSFRYLALGDSYTIGESVAAGQRFPSQLVDSLRSYGVKMGDPVVLAKTGWTTDELLDALDQKKLPDDFDLVSLLIGVNNQYRGRPVEEFRQDLSRLIERAIRCAGNRPDHVVVISIPDWGVTPFGSNRDQRQIADQIDEFNKVTREEAELNGLTFIDITPDSRLAAEDPTLVASDGLHPSEIMYGKWVEKLVPTVLWILAST